MLGFHYAIIAGTICSKAVMRRIAGQPRLRFLLRAVKPSGGPTYVDQLSPHSIEVSLIVQAHDDSPAPPVTIPIAVEPPLAQELEPHCAEGVQLIVSGHFHTERRRDLSVLEVVATQAWFV